MSSPKILFVSCSVGMGHVRAADALLSTLRLLHPEIEAEHIDLMDFIGPVAKNFYFESYNFMAKRTPEIWGIIYHATNSPGSAKIFNQLTKISKMVGSKKFFQFVKNFQPDYILCTHFVPADLISNFSKKYPTSARIGLLLTDYRAHPLLFASTNQDYFTATDAMRAEMITLGANPNRIYATGIPTSPVFSQNKPKQELAEQYQVNPQIKTILFLAGGNGFIRIDQAVTSLFEYKQPMNIFAIAGKNKKLFKQLSELAAPKHINLKVIGWTEKIDEYLRLADLVVTKPGGLTISECLFLQKPMILIDPVPGQEEENVKYLEQNHFGINLKNTNDLPKIIKQFFSEKKLFKSPPPQPNASKKIINLILKNLAD